MYGAPGNLRCCLAGRLMRAGIRRRWLSPSHNPDDERFACCLNDLAGDDRKVVVVQDPLDLGYQPTGQAEVAVGDAGDRGDRLARGEVSSRSWPTQTRCRCAGLSSRYDLRFAGLRLVRRRQGVGWLMGGSPAGEEPEGVVSG